MKYIYIATTVHAVSHRCKMLLGSLPYASQSYFVWMRWALQKVEKPIPSMETDSFISHYLLLWGYKASRLQSTFE